MVYLSSDPASQLQPASPDIEIVVRMPEPWTHYYHVSMTVSHLLADSIDLVMPVWTPGSYVVREFGRNVRDFSAAGAIGNRLHWEKISKHTWRVRANKEPNVSVSYRVYAFERSVRTSFLDRSHGFISGAGVFMYVEGKLHSPYRIRIEPYLDWSTVSTSLEAVPGKDHVFQAPDFDILVDSPIEIGNQQVLEFEAQGIRHTIAIYGDGNLSPERLTSDFRRIAETAAEVFGEFPYRHYTFLLQLLDDGFGGLEHLNSCSIQVSRWSFKPEEAYRKTLALVAHELFHAWNVKRLRPFPLGPFDYTRENYTRLLWMAEGFTEYYSYLLLRRSGLMNVEHYLAGLAGRLREYLQTPGRHVDSAAEASFDAWIKHYRRDAHSHNATVSYYSKGELIALVIDLEIRQLTAGACSLDDVLRKLYRKYYKQFQRAFNEIELRLACEETAGRPLTEIFEGYVYGTAEMDFDRYLNHAGLRIGEQWEGLRGKGFLGASARTREGRTVVSSVTAGTAAYEHGLNVNDEILAVDGYRVDEQSLVLRLEENAPGTKVDLTIARDGRLITLPVVLGEQPVPELKVLRIEQPTPEQKRIYQSWSRSPWPSQ